MASTQVYGASRLRLAACNVRTQCGFQWQITCFDFPHCCFWISLCLQEISREILGFCLFVCLSAVLFNVVFGVFLWRLNGRFAVEIIFVCFLLSDRFSHVKRMRCIDYFGSSFLWYDLLFRVFAVVCRCINFLFLGGFCLSLLSVSP